mmetsp:Transcript_68216/g.142563  ORF Transcript_68216/g.142563 Transcript_68216/m.142563 type:complete len:98 (-) Transcript_68216:2711-3004(-)
MLPSSRRMIKLSKCSFHVKEATGHMSIQDDIVPPSVKDPKVRPAQQRGICMIPLPEPPLGKRQGIWGKIASDDGSIRRRDASRTAPCVAKILVTLGA